MEIRFMSIGSGSCGNCYYLGVGDYGILIDAGIPSKSIRAALKKENIPFESICAIFVTHDHADHIKSLGVISGKANIPVYATREVHKGITHNYCTTKLIDPMYVRYVEKEEKIVFRDFEITPFEVPHDGSDNVGYFIEVGDKRFCIATDLGEITEVVSSYVEQANYLVIESNYEEQIPCRCLVAEVAAGTRHTHLQEFRVTSHRKHLLLVVRFYDQIIGLLNV